MTVWFPNDTPDECMEYVRGLEQKLKESEMNKKQLLEEIAKIYDLVSSLSTNLREAKEQIESIESMIEDLPENPEEITEDDDVKGDDSDDKG